MTLTTKPNGIFHLGDTVRLNDVKKTQAKVRGRTGKVVGYSRKNGKLRVLWNGLKRPQIVEGTLLQLVDDEVPALAPREAVLCAISEELEKLRDARFERHLKWPRPPHIYQSANAPRERSLVDYRAAFIIGLLALGIALGALVMLIR